MTKDESNLKRELATHCPTEWAHAARTRRCLLVIRHSALVISLLLFTAGCDWMPGKPKLADRWVPDTAVTNFAALYNTHCAACHAAGSRGLAAAHPLDDPVLLAVTDPAAFRKVIVEGVPGTLMPPFGEFLAGPFTDAQLDLIVTNIFAQWSRPQEFVGVKLPRHRAPPGDAKRGAVAYQTYCASCHGAEGKGGEKGGPVIAPSYLALVSDQGLRTTVIAGRGDLGMPDWRGYVAGKPMSDQEISDVVAWLASHRNQPITP